MDWLVLILGVPAILIPLVLLFGFAGCCPPFASPCTADSDCATGMRCIDGGCFAADDPGEPFFPLSPPENLVARAIDDRSVSLTWTNTEPGATFQIERAPEDGEDFQPISPSGNISPTGTIDDTAGLQEGVTYLYQVRALVDQEPPSDPSDISSATVLPATPVNLTATAAGIDRINLFWTNVSTVATEFILERREFPVGTFAPIGPVPPGAATFPDSVGLREGTTYEYRLSAVVDGFENSVGQPVESLPATTAPTTTLAFSTAFTGTLMTDQASAAGQGICLVQRLKPTLLAGAGTQVRTQVRITLRGSTMGSLTLDRITISKVGNTGDPYDSGPDLTDLAPGAVTTIAGGSTVMSDR